MKDQRANISGKCVQHILTLRGFKSAFRTSLLSFSFTTPPSIYPIFSEVKFGFNAATAAEKERERECEWEREREELKDQPFKNSSFVVPPTHPPVWKSGWGKLARCRVRNSPVSQRQLVFLESSGCHFDFLGPILKPKRYYELFGHLHGMKKFLKVFLV